MKNEELRMKNVNLFLHKVINSFVDKRSHTSNMFYMHSFILNPSFLSPL